MSSILCAGSPAMLPIGQHTECPFTGLDVFCQLFCFFPTIAACMNQTKISLLAPAGTDERGDAEGSVRTTVNRGAHARLCMIMYAMISRIVLLTLARPRNVHACRPLWLEHFFFDASSSLHQSFLIIPRFLLHALALCIRITTSTSEDQGGLGSEDVEESYITILYPYKDSCFLNSEGM